MVQKRSYSVVVITPDFESGNLSSNLGKTYHAFLAQSVERVAVNHKVSGSIPEGSVCVIAQYKLYLVYIVF